MDPNLPELQSLSALTLLSIPIVYALAAALSAPVARPEGAAAQPAGAGNPGHSAQRPWRLAGTLCALAFALSLLAAALAIGMGAAVLHLPPLFELDAFGSLSLSVRLDVLSCCMLLLVSFVGGIILRYSRRYLDGDPGAPRYLRAFLATLASVSLLVVSNNLLVLALAWMATSVALHRLLNFYAERPQARIAAHKKFLVSRISDLSLLGAVALVAGSLGTLEMDQVFASITAGDGLSPLLQGAAVLLVASAALKCAQLPFHGWLVQVMEAPTPVSALLHAGVVNIGGFLMIRMAPLMVEAELAQTLLVVCGTTTAVLAALIMSAQSSVKVALAWSTCAQMGFMLMECGLGAYSLALLHLVGHSLYKAHAFLASGSVVEQWRARVLRPARSGAPLLRTVGAGLTAALLVLGLGSGLGLSPALEPGLWSLVVVLTLALTPLLQRAAEGGARQLLGLSGAAVAMVGLYALWHALFARLLGPVPGSGVPPVGLLMLVAGGFGALFLLQSWMNARPSGRLACLLHEPLQAGLYLDEAFTRASFRLWPARLPNRTGPAPAILTANQEG